MILKFEKATCYTYVTRI